jgi:hypothetical protein
MHLLESVHSYFRVDVIIPLLSNPPFYETVPQFCYSLVVLEAEQLEVTIVTPRSDLMRQNQQDLKDIR